MTRACAWCDGPIPAKAWRDAVCCSVRCRQARHRFLRAVGYAESVAPGRPKQGYTGQQPLFTPGKSHVVQGRADASSPAASEHVLPIVRGLARRLCPAGLGICPVTACIVQGMAWGWPPYPGQARCLALGFWPECFPRLNVKGGRRSFPKETRSVLDVEGKHVTIQGPSTDLSPAATFAPSACATSRPGLLTRRFLYGHPGSLRPVRDLGGVPVSCPLKSGQPGRRSIVWLPARLPLLVVLVLVVFRHVRERALFPAVHPLAVGHPPGSGLVLVDGERITPPQPGTDSGRSCISGFVL